MTQFVQLLERRRLLSIEVDIDPQPPLPPVDPYAGLTPSVHFVGATRHHAPVELKLYPLYGTVSIGSSTHHASGGPLNGRLVFTAGDYMSDGQFHTLSFSGRFRDHGNVATGKVRDTVLYPGWRTVRRRMNGNVVTIPVPRKVTRTYAVRLERVSHDSSATA